MLNTAETPKNWASLVSGSGSTMAKMGEAVLSGEVQSVHFSLVISSDPNAGAKERLDALGEKYGTIIPFEAVDIDSFRDDLGNVDQGKLGERMNEMLRDYGIWEDDVVTQNGWLPLTPDLHVGTWLNQHPNRLPHTKGLHGKQPHAVVLQYAQATGQYYSEPVVQRVSKGKYDEGALVVTRKVPIDFIDLELSWDDLGSATANVQKKVLVVEHQINIEALKLAGQGKLVDRPQVELTAGQWELLRPMRRIAREIFPNG